MSQIIIREPIWKSNSVGLNVNNLPDSEDIDVKISYRDKSNNLVFPDNYRMKVVDIKKYPTQIIKGKIVLHIVPIKDFKIII